MAKYFKEITTRYGDTYDADSTDNISLITSFFNDTSKFNVVGDVITIGADSTLAADRFDGLDADDNPAEFIFFNKQIIVNANSALVSNGVNGCHFWFVNCSITINGDAPSSGSGQHQFQRLGPAQRGDGSGNGTRADFVNTGASAKATDTSWNYYNCTFNINGDSDDSGVIVAAHLEACDFNVASPTGGIMRIYPMQNCIWDGVVYNLSTSNTNQGHAYELFTEPTVADGINLINTYGYTGNNQNITYFEYEVVKETDGAYSQPVLYRIFTEFNALDGTGGSSTNFVNPKADLTSNGNIWWRWPNPQGVAVIRQRIQRGYYKTPNFIPGNGRNDVKLYINSNFSSTAAGNALNTSVAASGTDRIYTSGGDGILEGTYNFNDDTTGSSEDWGNEDNPIDIPLFSLKWDSNVAAEATGDYFGTTEELYSHTVTEMSLWGTRYVSPDTRTKANDYRNATEAAADDGRYVPLDIQEQIVDGEDLVMSGFSENPNNIITAFVANNNEGNTVSFNDIAAGWKYGVWNRYIGFDDWSSTAINGSTFDVSGVDRNVIEWQVADSGTYIEEGTNSTDVRFRIPVDSNGDAEIVTDSDSHIQTLVVDEMKVLTPAENSYSIDGGTFKVNTIRNTKSFDGTTLPLSDNFTLNNVDISTVSGTGRTDFFAEGGRTYQFNDLGSNTQIDVNQTGTGTAKILVGGSTPVNAVTTTSSDISIKKVITVTMDGGTGHTASSTNVSKVVSRYGTNLSDAQANTLNTGASDYSVSTSGSVYTFAWEVDLDESLFAAVAIDGFEIVQLVNTLDTSVDLVAIDSDNLDFDASNYNTWGSADVSNVTVTTPTDPTSDFTVVINNPGDFSVGATDATVDKFRRWLREDVQQSNEYMDGVLQGFITSDYVQWGNDTLVFNTDRMKISRTANTARSWRVAEVALNRVGTDLFDSLTSEGADGTQIYFTPDRDGAGISQIQAAINDARDQIVGHTSLPDDSTGRNVKEAYTQAKGAKNAAFAAG